MIMEKSPLLDRDWSISVLQVLAADEITNYSIIMMADEKNGYYKTASTHTKISYNMIFLFTITRNCRMKLIHDCINRV